MQVRQSVTHSSTDSKSLHDQIVKAIAKAQITGSPILFSYSQNWECIDPLLLLASKSDSQQPKFYWEQPSADLVLAGAGSVAQISVPNHDLGDRFICAKKFVKLHLTNAIVANHPDLKPDLKSLDFESSSSVESYIHIFGAFSFYHSSNNPNDLPSTQIPDPQSAIEFPNLLFLIV